MAGETPPPKLCARKQPNDHRPCLAALPIDVHFRIIKLALATGQERDVSALAMTSKTMYFMVNHELHKLVVRHKTFFLVHWAAMENRLDTLKFALAHDANPNQMRTSTAPLGTNNHSFRPLGYDLQARTDADLDICVELKRREILNRERNSLSVYSRVWFSCARLSTASSAQMKLLLDHYDPRITSRPIPHQIGLSFDNNEARLVDLPEALNENFAFPQSMSPVYMDRRDTKISFVRLFQFWDTPLHIAAVHDRVSVAKALLANGGDVDCTATQVCRCLRDDRPTSLTSPRRGNLVVTYTPLHVAICMGSYRVAKVLVMFGAYRMARVFRSNGAREWLVENALHRALSWREDVRFNYNFIEFLLDQGYAARLGERNFEGLTPLQIVCLAGYEPAQMDVLGLLLRYGADPNSQCSSPPGFSYSAIPLHPGWGNNDRATIGLWVTRQGNFQVAKLLLDHGADAKARSSAMHETMLFAVCTARTGRATPADPTTENWRMNLLDDLLARDTAEDLNTFCDNDRNLLMRLIRARIFEDLPSSDFGEWESKVFMAGADIMAGANEGKVTPFECMIIDVFRRWYYWTGDSNALRKHLTDVCGKIVVILEASGINKHRHRPAAGINRLWEILTRTPSLSIGAAVYILLALMRGGFSPAEVDRHGDTAMTSFLRLLIENPLWAKRDSRSHCHQWRGWTLPMIMALLQENDAALHKTNEKGLTAFNYLDQIVNYEGEKEDLVMLRGTMRRSVRVGQDDHGAKCFKFHPMLLRGRISGDDTILRLLNNPSRWLACEHLCKGGYCSSFGTNWQCSCTKTHIQTLARCRGDCCLSRDSQQEFIWLDDRHMTFE